MLGSTFIFNPILWIILLSMSFFGSFLPKDQPVVVPAQAYYGFPWEQSYGTRDWSYDNVDDDLFTLKKHYKLGTDVYVFQATRADVPKNQLQDVVFTDEKGNKTPPLRTSAAFTPHPRTERERDAPSIHC